MYFLCYGHGLFSTICIRIAYYCVGTRIIEAHFPELSMLYILYIFSNWRNIEYLSLSLVRQIDTV